MTNELDTTRPLQTRDGKYKAMNIRKTYPYIIATIGGKKRLFFSSGHYAYGTGELECSLDLVYAPEPKKLQQWMVIWPTTGFATREEAENHVKRYNQQFSHDLPLAIKLVEFYEGEGLAP